MSVTKTVVQLLLALVVATWSSPALAVPTSMIHVETPDCDLLFIPDDVHELGDFNEFPADEALGALQFGNTSVSPCPLLDDPTIPNVIVEMRNLSGIDWEEVWYVADAETTITNFDGEANQGLLGLPAVHEAFRIDYDISDPGGMHHPLIFESGPADGIWQATESWRFILQDYTNTLGLPADAITSIGVGSASSTPTAVDAAGNLLGPSSGSIIAVTKIPEPTTCVLLLVGLISVVCQRP